MRTLVELTPNRDLLDPHFEGYKLSLDSVPIYRQTLSPGVDHVCPNEDQYSFLHVKLFGLHNHLYGDPWCPDDVYFIDEKWAVKHNVVNENTGRLEDIKQVWEIPSNHERKPGHYNTSLSFASPDLAVIGDGAGTLHVVDTGHRKESASEWKVVFSDEVCGKENPFIVISSRAVKSNEVHELHCLLVHVSDAKLIETMGSGDADKGLFVTVVDWITLMEGSNNTWSMKRARQLVGKCGLDYAGLEGNCTSIYLGSDKPFGFVSDSEKPLDKKSEPEQKESTVTKPDYMWTETAEDITVWFTLPKTAVKEDLCVNTKSNELAITYRDKVLLQGDTWQALDESLTTWTFEKGKLEVCLSKTDSGNMWKELVKGDQRGEYLLDPGTAEEIHQRLAHLCSEELNPEPQGGTTPGFDSQLEECDALPVDTSLLTRINGEEHEITHQINLGAHQWLFNVQLKPEKPLAMCLRHDVDGLVWQPDSDLAGECWKCEHVGTFLAFGYVQASKEQKKFTTCAPDFSYVCICEATRHMYIYRQPSDVAGELRNRRTGIRVSQIAKQVLLNLDSAEEVLGVHAASRILYVLTKDTLFGARINE